MTTTSVVTAPDGRELCVESGGDPDGRPVLTHNGTPNSRLLHRPAVQDAEERGIHLLSYDRPGYGGSTPHPGRSVADCAGDVQAIAGVFGYERLAVWGISGGGPHALACAALLPDLVTAVATLASIAPYDAPGLDYFAGMGQENVDDMLLYDRDPVASRTKLEADREDSLQLSPDMVLEAWPSLLSPVDAMALTGELADYLVRCMKDGLAPGGEGWWEDAVAFQTPWGFQVDEITVPVQVWHGAQDRFVPIQHGEWIAGQIHGVDSHLTETDGHLTLEDHLPEIHDWLLGHD
jgi:pimeloyl-ACP methyl ester carboxylesterase